MIVLAALFAAVNVSAEGWLDARPGLGIAVLLACAAVALYIRPSVVVEEDRVQLRNVTHRVTVGYDRVVLVDTRWALELRTDDGRIVSAWAAPAPGALMARRTRPEDLEKLPPSTYTMGSARVGDRPGSASGDAALLVRKAWSEWTEAHPDHLADRTQPASRRTLDPIGIVLIVVGVGAAVAGFVL